MNVLIAPLRPNYIASDFRAGQSVLLRYDGASGVPRFMHGDRALIVKATAKRLVVMRVRSGEQRELRITPHQIATILDESLT